MREILPPTRKKVPGIGAGSDPVTEETHPAFGLIGASRVQSGSPGASLFDSDIRHQHTVVVRLSTCSRQRDLSRDWLHGEKEFVEVEMSEAQWASFVSSMNSGSGVPCTIRRREDEMQVPGLPHEPRLHESISEVRDAAQKAFATVQKAMATYAEKKNAANLRTLESAIRNAPANVEFAGNSLTEHAENVVQRARADVEAMVASKAAQYGLEPGDLGGPDLLDEGNEGGAS